MAGACAAGPPQTILERLLDSRRLAAEMLVQFTKTVEAGHRVVISDTDEQADAAIAEARAAAVTIETDGVALAAHFDASNYRNEATLLEEFRATFREFQAVDRELLELARLDTNVKAERLAFGEGRKLADAMVMALRALAIPAPAADNWRLRAVAAETVASLRNLQALQAPHIIEANDATMTAMEEQMNRAEAEVRAGLTELSQLAGPGRQASVREAAETFDRFAAAHREVIRLSRQNSNVRALALTLGRKRTLTARCEEQLRAIQAALAGRELGPRR
jgi:hypothetical protein